MRHDSRRVPAGLDADRLTLHLRRVARTRASSMESAFGPTTSDPARLVGSETAPAISMLEAHRDQYGRLLELCKDAPQARELPGDDRPPDPLPVLADDHEVVVHGPQDRDRFLPLLECMNLIANADAMGVAVNWYAGSHQSGGYAFRSHSRPRLRVPRDVRNPPRDIDTRDLPAVTVAGAVIAVNRLQDWAPTFDVLVHEIAHVLLGHLDGWSTLRQPGMRVADRGYLSTRPAEIEALSVQLLVTVRRGAGGMTAHTQLRPRATVGRVTGELGQVDLHQVMAVADIITAWCAEPPRSRFFELEWLPRLGSGGRTVAQTEPQR